VKKLVKDLSVGDILTPTNVKVVVAPSAGISTPSGKVDLVVESAKGFRYSRTWNKRTEVSIKDKE